MLTLDFMQTRPTELRLLPALGSGNTSLFEVMAVLVICWLRTELEIVGLLHNSMQPSCSEIDNSRDDILLGRSQPY
jgi:hypothetical protein